MIYGTRQHSTDCPGPALNISAYAPPLATYLIGSIPGSWTLDSYRPGPDLDTQ